MGDYTNHTVSEKGKIVVNRCLDKGYSINTKKLEKLLILMQGFMLSIYQTPFFNQYVISRKNGLMIDEVDRDFIKYVVKFEKKFDEYITLLNAEEYIVNKVIEKYGSLNDIDLKEKTPLKLLENRCCKENIGIIPNDIIKDIFGYYFLGFLDDLGKSEDELIRKLQKN